MESIARLRYLRGSAQKVRLVADQIRGRNVQEAVNVLELSPKTHARPLAKLLKSAVANAEHGSSAVDVDRLYVKEIFVDQGPSMKRVRPAPMGRAFRVQKRSSHVTIKLDTRKGDEKGKKK